MQRAARGGGKQKNGNEIIGYTLKADIKHYFETVDHEVLLSILRKKIKDEDVIELIRLILSNHKTETPDKAMPLGNLTSQFFANIYLGELDYFVKHKLRVKYYIRYVDDFLILDKNKNRLEKQKREINQFLLDELKLELHPEKSKIIPLRSGITLLGFRVFFYCKFLKKSNLKKHERRLSRFETELKNGEISRERVRLSLAGWEGYAKMANTYKLRTRVRKQIKQLLETP